MTFEHFSVENGELIYRERLSPWARGLAAGMGLGMLVIPAIVLHRFTAGAGILNLLAVGAGVLCPLLLSIVFFCLALVGTKQIRFDTTDRRAILSTRGPLGRRERKIEYQDIKSIDVLTREGLDDPPQFVLLLKVSGRRAMELGSFPTTDQAEHWQRRVRSEIISSSTHREQRQH